MSEVVTLHVQRRGGGLEYRLELPQSSDPVHHVVTQVISDRELASLQAGVAGLLSGGASAHFEAEARARGRILLQTLVPEQIRAELDGVREPLLISTAAYGIAFELFCREEFWGLRYALGKQLLTDRAPRRRGEGSRPRRPRVLIISSDPRGDLGHVQVEAERVFTSWQPYADVFLIAGAEASFDAVLTRLSEEYTVIHYCGHVIGGRSDAAGLLLAEERVLSGAVIESVLSGAPLVFVNGCASARTGAPAATASWEGEIAPLTQGFLLGGARAVVGTCSDVGDADAASIAVEFYRRVIEEVPVGEALRLARQYGRSLAAQSPSWLSFVLYGSPVTSVLGGPPALGQRARRASAVPEGRVQPPPRSGAARRWGAGIGALLGAIALALAVWEAMRPSAVVKTINHTAISTARISTAEARDTATVSIGYATRPPSTDTSAPSPSQRDDGPVQSATASEMDTLSRRAFIFEDEPDLTKAPELFVGSMPDWMYVSPDFLDQRFPYELHVIRIYEGPEFRIDSEGQVNRDAVQVTIAPSAKPVVVYLICYEHVKWDIHFDQGAQLAAIYYSATQNTIIQVPPGAPEPQQIGNVPFDDQARNRSQAVKKLQSILRMPVTSLQDSNQGTTFRVPNYTDPSKLAALFAAHRSLLRNRTANLIGSYYLAIGGGIVVTNGQGGRATVDAQLGVRSVTFDAMHSKFYLTTYNEFYEVDGETGNHTKRAPPPQFPTMGRIGGVAYDNKRHRVLIATSIGDYHYYYYPEADEWRVVSTTRTSGGLEAVAFGRGAEALYGLRERGWGTRVLEVFDAELNRTDEILLSDPAALRTDQGKGFVDAQMVSTDQGLLVCLSDHDAPDDLRCFLVSVPSGEIRLAHVDVKD